MKRNRGGERYLDHIILAAIRGLDRARLEYPQVPRRPDPDHGSHIRRASERDHRRQGDLLGRARRRRNRHRGAAPRGRRYDYTSVQPMVETVRAAGLGVTIHLGEETSFS